MTNAHKAALAKGRTEGRTVRRYLDDLRGARTQRGRRRTRGTIEARMTSIEALLAEADPLEELRLVQERIDLTGQLDALANAASIDDHVEDFIGVAKSYSQRQGISYAAWREVGVPAAVLKRAGISRFD